MVDLKTFWKSNPYLERHFTGESTEEAPQFIVIDLEKTEEVNALRIAWGAPFARSYRVQHWTGEDAMKKPAAGAWQDFAGGQVTGGKGRGPPRWCWTSSRRRCGSCACCC